MATTKPQAVNGNGDSWYRRMTAALTPPVLILVASSQAYFLQQIHGIDKRVVAIEASRFTAEDGLAVWKGINECKAQIAKLPTEVPPKWFIDRVDKLEKKIDALAAEVRGRPRG